MKTIIKMFVKRYGLREIALLPTIINIYKRYNTQINNKIESTKQLQPIINHYLNYHPLTI